LDNLDWGIVAAYFLLTIFIGLFAGRKAGKGFRAYFLSGNDMPWWLLGVSMVATTFSADTPNLVTDIVRTNGVAGNWVWWSFLLTGMMTCFIYARLWRRSGIGTDLEFYELRYSGKASRLLRGFRAIYLGVFFNIMIMATVLLAGMKIAGVLLDLNKFQTVLLVGLVTLAYSAVGGLRGVLLTDFFQFFLSMGGTIAAAVYILDMPEIGGLNALVSAPALQSSISIFPDFSKPEVYVPLFLVPLAVQWWSVWYPGAEPGGGGYVAQRMLAARNEKGAVKATLLFNFAHYALRPWPWILIALASLIIFPDLEALRTAFPNMAPDIVKDDLAFPAMISLLPKGLLGLLVAALLAALMSTISTHLNWGASYMVHDFYKRFLRPQAGDQEQVRVGRWCTVVLMLLASVFALFLENALQAFQILLQIGAGTGLLFLLRWFWWRINAYSELAAMVISFFLAVYFEMYYDGPLLPHERMMIGVALTTVSWLLVTIITRPTDNQTLHSFYKLIRPYKTGWKPVITQELLNAQRENAPSLSKDLFLVFVGTVMIYAALLGTGWLIYGQIFGAIFCLFVAIVSAIFINYSLRNKIMQP